MELTFRATQHDAAHCLHACRCKMCKNVQHEPYAGTDSSQLANFGHQAESKNNGAGSCHSEAGDSSAATQAQCMQIFNVICTCTTLPLWKGPTLGKHAIHNRRHDAGTEAGLVDEHCVLIRQGRWQTQRSKMLDDLSGLIASANSAKADAHHSATACEVLVELPQNAQA